MNQFPQSPGPDAHQGQQPPVYQDPNQPQFQQPQMYAQPQQQQQYAGSPAPQQGGAYGQPPQNPGMPPQHPGMPPQQQTGTVYQSVTPIASLNRSPAPADCPACGQRAMTNVAYETGNTVQ